MKFRKNSIILLSITALLLTACVEQQIKAESSFAETFPGQFLVGDVYILKKHEKVDGDIAGVGTTLVIEDGATVMGDITLVGSTLEIYGRVAGDVTVVAGSSFIEESALITGSFNQAYHQLNLHPDANVYGEINSYEFPTGIETADVDGLKGLIQWLQPSSLIIYHSVRLIFFTLITLLASTLFKASTFRAVSSLKAHLAASWGAGLISLVAVPVVSTILLITICLSPVALIILIIFVISLLWGWTILASAFGQQLVLWLRLDLEDLPTAILGTVILGAITGFISIIPCIGFLFNTTIAAAGIGSVLLSRFGTVVDK